MIQAGVHGLVVALPRPVAGLRLVRPGTLADVVVSEGVVALDGTEDLVGGQWLGARVEMGVLKHPTGGFLLTVNERPTIAVSSDGGEVVLSQWDATTVRLLIDQTLPLVSELHGRTALHATTIRLDGVTVALAGASGSGKSTLADCLAPHGATVISEDVSALGVRGDEVWVWGGPRVVRRRPRNDESPGSTPDGKVPSAIPSGPRASRLDVLVVLGDGPPDGAETAEPLAPLAHLFAPYVNDAPSLVRHLDLAAALVSSARVLRLSTYASSPAETTAAIFDLLGHAVSA